MIIMIALFQVDGVVDSGSKAFVKQVYYTLEHCFSTFTASFTRPVLLDAIIFDTDVNTTSSFVITSYN